MLKKKGKKKVLCTCTYLIMQWWVESHSPWYAKCWRVLWIWCITCMCRCVGPFPHVVKSVTDANMWLEKCNQTRESLRLLVEIWVCDANVCEHLFGLVCLFVNRHVDGASMWGWQKTGTDLLSPISYDRCIFCAGETCYMLAVVWLFWYPRKIYPCFCILRVWKMMPFP